MMQQQVVFLVGFAVPMSTRVMLGHAHHAELGITRRVKSQDATLFPWEGVSIVMPMSMNSLRPDNSAQSEHKVRRP